MQFHLNGFHGGDPRIAEPARRDGTGDDFDVLIVGSGPAGLTLAAQLSAFPDIRTRVIEQREERLVKGQADGIACRTVEMFEAFGFSEHAMREAYQVNETVFWKPDAANRRHISRTERIQDVEDGLSECPHLILNQARVHDYYLDVMRKSAARLEPDYSRRLLDLEVGGGDVPVTARIERCDPGHAGEVETIRARFVVGCDGARSAVRRSLDLPLRGDSANQAWGVMDVLAVTDFPDIRCKALIQSANEGNLLIIPREGGYLARLYIELDKLSPDERVAARNITPDHLVTAAQRILRPYTLDVKEITWWSVYEIGQRICDRFDNLPEDADETGIPRVFILGDACHTHSPKAGQGMNVSMQDGFNLGWKLAAVLRGQCTPALLRSYSAERRAIAQELIDFDRVLAKMFSAPAKDPDDPDSTGVDPEEFRRYFIQHGRYTAGVETHYTPCLITGPAGHQALATGFVIGKRFHSAPVIRLADAKPMQLGHTVKADGRWRLFAFTPAGDLTSPSSKIRALANWLAEDPDSPVRRFTPADADIDSVIDFRAVFQEPHRDLDIGDLPPLLLPAKGRYGLRDYEKVFCADRVAGNDIFTMRGIDRRNGCMVVVRPDQYVAHILPLNDYAALGEFFGRFMLEAG